MANSTVLRLTCIVVLSAGTHFVAAQRGSETGQRRDTYRWDVQKSGVADDLRAVFFLNPTLGWAAGDSNTILKTSDGGATWTRLGERQERLNRFIAIDRTPTATSHVGSPG